MRAWSAAPTPRSSSISPEPMACRCSDASTRNVARRFSRNCRSVPGTGSDRVVLDELLQSHAEFVQIAGGDFELACARDVLRARLLDVLHRAGHLIHADQLLLARGRDLGGGLRR